MLSSVLHEIYHYLPPQEVKDFWRRVWTSGFDTIAIRDMVDSSYLEGPSNPDDVIKVREKADAEKLLEWEQQWGSIDNKRSMTHFLLTCPYQQNWVREMQENYFSYTLQDILQNVPEGYDIAFKDEYSLSYNQKRIAEEFGINLQEPTHIKIILRKAQNTLQKIGKNSSILLH